MGVDRATLHRVVEKASDAVSLCMCTDYETRLGILA